MDPNAKIAAEFDAALLSRFVSLTETLERNGEIRLILSNDDWKTIQLWIRGPYGETEYVVAVQTDGTPKLVSGVFRAADMIL